VAKTVFITGASSGIGRALALELAGRGYDLFLTARRLDMLEQVRTDIAAADPARRVEVRQLDVTDDADVATAIAEAAEKLGRCDIVVANAGVGNSPRVGEGGMERNRLIVETNLIGAMATIDAAVALFRRQGGGQIVGIASVAGVRGLPGSASYSASKAGVAVYLESVRAETYREPITVTTIAPGYIDTPDQPGHEEPAVPGRRREGRADHCGSDRAWRRIRDRPTVSLDRGEAAAARASHFVAGAERAAARLRDPGRLSTPRKSSR